MRCFREQERLRMPQETIVIISLIIFSFGVLALALAYADHSTRHIRRD
jgi:amino acid transporter